MKRGVHQARSALKVFFKPNGRSFPPLRFVGAVLHRAVLALDPDAVEPELAEEVDHVGVLVTADDAGWLALLQLRLNL